MKTTLQKIITLKEAARQVKNLLSAVARINNVKCPLSISQIILIIDGGEQYQKCYINKYNASITFNKPFDESLYICINITWVEEDKYIINIK